ncbi:PREDICTED: non-specific lipid-transfer protein C6 [Theobroma cacao]|uniref:Non-specific lipid-transfer protein C6 n=1 Tax=Theobroma cacao TaxID=3641 RepID=A0AB32VBY6_THECC|nr:PREDICTED: non-specific lipid-transfer protein C6 [Theobroma cacao]
MATTILIAILHLTLLAVAAQPLPPPPEQPGCVAELVAFSPCLPYVSAPPNNATDIVAPQCCNAWSSAFESGDSYCFCYILRQPLIFGFPLNQSRVASLSSFCKAKNRTSLYSLCSSGVPALPPLPSTIDSGRLKPSSSGSDNDSSALIYSPPESAGRSPPPPSSSAEPAIVSSATTQIDEQSSWFLLGMMIFLLN